MQLLLPRLFQEAGKATIGHLYVDGKYECFALEPAAVEPAHEGHPCIPAGTYRVGLRNSPRFGLDTIEVLKVPERTDILIHAGNFPKDSLGCILPGYDHTPGSWEVHRSRDALAAIKKRVLEAVRDNEPIWIEVVDSFNVRGGGGVNG